MDEQTQSQKESMKRDKLLAAGDSKGLHKMEFGIYVREMRLKVDGLTQKKAAEEAEISRSEWSRIEAGMHLPRPNKLDKMADALEVQPSALYRQAGYEVPQQYARYDLRAASKDFAAAIKEASDFPEFITRMQVVWKLFTDDQTNKRGGVLMDFTQATLLAAIFEKMNAPQRINLAHELVRSVSAETITAHLHDAVAFVEDLKHKVKLSKGYKGI